MSNPVPPASPLSAKPPAGPLMHRLLTLAKQRATGELHITPVLGGTPPWQIYVYQGRLVHATGGIHPVRRWHSAIQRHCPGLLASDWLTTATATASLWELELLNQAAARQIITPSQAQRVSQQLIQEVIFACMDPVATLQWQPDRTIPQPVVFLAVEPVLQVLVRRYAQWQHLGWNNLAELPTPPAPTLSLKLKNAQALKAQTSPALYANLLRILQGQPTLWELAARMRRPVPTVLQSFLPLLRCGIVELSPVPDWPIPCTVPTVASPRPKALVACIDDSPAVGQAIAHILQPLGYEVMSILHPLKGIATLLERKPDLIFLDLIMPNTNGYELCTFLRKTSAFQTTPIIILTGQDGVLDRMRAKLAGSSAFLSKPPDRVKLLQLLETHLQPPPSPSKHLPSSPEEGSAKDATTPYNTQTDTQMGITNPATA
jgi:two-component system, chemotaxis family, response regulator PixG